MSAIRAYSEAIFTLLREYNESKSKEVKESIRTLIRQYGNNIPARCSKKAHDWFPDIDFSKMKYGDQYKFDPYREKLILEHKETVYELFNKIEKAESVEDVERILVTSELAWITRAEDEILTVFGYGTIRPDSDAAYKECGIELI